MLSLTVSDVRIYPVAGTPSPKLALRIDYRGLVRGSLYAWGTPTYDKRTERLSVRDLQVAPGPNGLLSDVAGALLARGRLIASLREKATFELNAALDEMSSAMSHAYAHRLGDGVAIEARVRRVSLADVAVNRNGATADIEIRGTVKAQASVDVSKVFTQDDRRQQASR
jgi:hypothetical protein